MFCCDSLLAKANLLLLFKPLAEVVFDYYICAGCLSVDEIDGGAG